MSETPKTLHVKLTDTVIRQHAANPHIRDLRDPRYPAVLLRYRADRTRASWHVVRNTGGKTILKKAANWPDVGAATMIASLSAVILELLGEPSGGLVDQVATVGELLDWYADRCSGLRYFSESRKATIRTITVRHLKPALGRLALSALDKPGIERALILPLQGVYSTAYVRQVFGVLQSAFNRAQRVELIRHNPLSGVTLSQFIRVDVTPRGAALRPDQLPELLEAWGRLWQVDPRRVFLAILMLLHATRVGESRKAKWAHFNLSGRAPAWNLPTENTKTKAAHVLPLTPFAVTVLQAYRDFLKRRGIVSAWLFPGHDGQPLAARDATRWFDDLAGGEWTSHDLRKVARTGLADLGVDHWVGERLVNHALPQLDVTYIHTQAQGLMRDALERWHARLAEDAPSFFSAITGPVQPAERPALQPSNDAV